MTYFDLPHDLIKMISQRRVIPFIGAGFSAGLNLPDWDSLLSSVADELEDGCTYEDIKKYCNSDPLQIAEYYLLKCDGSIGPLRHAISNSIKNDINPVYSAAHVELVNLNCQQIYTTNYDDLLEKTFKYLGIESEVISLPKHVATTTGKKTQIVKYHGDLKYENTLVLTESSYYARLDFESPMDIKFRSDLLGKSVLFMGYSFRDINIRIIWFKLMRMMKDIPSSDRPNSFIVRFDNNPVLEKLYDAVGIKTIVLDPENKCVTSVDRTNIFNEFMYELVKNASPEGKMPGKQRSIYLSTHILNNIQRTLNEIVKQKSSPLTRSKRQTSIINFKIALAEASKREFPKELEASVNAILKDIIDAKIIINSSDAVSDFIICIFKYYGVSDNSVSAFLFCMSRFDSRSKLLDESKKIPWSQVWSHSISEETAEHLFKNFEKEIDGHINQEYHDNDIAYLADICYRITTVMSSNQQVKRKGKALLKRAGEVYESISTYTPCDGPPDVSVISAEISEKTPSENFDPSDFEEPF